MPVALATYLLALLPSFYLSAGEAAAQPIDRWHYIDQDSVLFTERVDGLHGAGLIQSDKIFAMLYLGLPGENGVVSVALPMEEPTRSLSSVLVSTSGQRFERVLDAEEMDIMQINGASIAYSFPISPDDIDLFKAAQTWTLQVGERAWSLTLTGSKKAIALAESKHNEVLRGLSSRTVTIRSEAPETED